MPDARRFHYAWIIAGMTFLILLGTAGVRATPGILIVPLEREFGWSRSTISFAISINLILFGLIGPFAASLITRWGVRRTVVGALIGLASGVALSTQMTEAWHFVFLWGIVVGCGTGMTSLVLGNLIVNRWFFQRRGLVLGILTASSATGQLVFLPMLASIVSSTGWRPAVLLVSGAAAGILLLAAIFLLDRPSDVGQRAFGEPEDTPIESPSAPVIYPIAALREGLRSLDFWLLAGSFFACGLSTNGLIGTHLIPACLDSGIPEVNAAGLLALMGLFDLVGTTISGWLSDRWDNRLLLCWYYAFRGLALICLPLVLVTNPLALYAFAVVYGLDWIATVPPTAKLTADAFGKAKAAVMFGWIVAAHQIGAAVAAFGAGTIRSVAGDYQRAFLISGAICLLTASMVLQINRRRKSMEEAKVLSPSIKPEIA